VFGPSVAQLMNSPAAHRASVALRVSFALNTLNMGHAERSLRGTSQDVMGLPGRPSSCHCSCSGGGGGGGGCGGGGWVVSGVVEVVVVVVVSSGRVAW